MSRGLSQKHEDTDQYSKINSILLQCDVTFFETNVSQRNIFLGE